jgi:hypothetical protein
MAPMFKGFYPQPIVVGQLETDHAVERLERFLEGAHDKCPSSREGEELRRTRRVCCRAGLIQMMRWRS